MFSYFKIGGFPTLVGRQHICFKGPSSLWGWMSWELVLTSSVHSRITMVMVLLFYSYHIAALPLPRHCFHRVVSRWVESRNVRKINFIHIWL